LVKSQSPKSNRASSMLSMPAKAEEKKKKRGGEKGIRLREKMRTKVQERKTVLGPTSGKV